MNEQIKTRKSVLSFLKNEDTFSKNAGQVELDNNTLKSLVTNAALQLLHEKKKSIHVG